MLDGGVKATIGASWEKANAYSLIRENDAECWRRARHACSVRVNAARSSRVARRRAPRNGWRRVGVEPARGAIASVSPSHDSTRQQPTGAVIDAESTRRVL